MASVSMWSMRAASGTPASLGDSGTPPRACPNSQDLREPRLTAVLVTGSTVGQIGSAESVLIGRGEATVLIAGRSRPCFNAAKMETKFCSTCGTRVASAARFCRACGTEVSEECLSCGAELVLGARNCGECGSAQAARTVFSESTKRPAAPSTPQSTPSASATSRQFGDIYRLGGLATTLVIFCGILFFVYALSAYSLFNRASLIGQSLDTSMTRALNQSLIDADNLVQAMASFYWITHLILLVLFIVWSWMATKNLQARDVPLKWRPGWAIGGWFVPVGMFWIPYQVTRDAWRLLPMANEGQRDQINGWWLFGFITSWASVIMFRFSWYATTPRELQVMDRVGGLGALWGALSVIAIAVTVRQVSKRHEGMRLLAT